MDLSWLHSNAFEVLALRKSNDASWDRRLSSKEVMAKIHVVEKYERREEEPQHQRELENPPQARLEKEWRDAKSGRSLKSINDEVSELSEPPVANVSVRSPSTASSITKETPIKVETAEEKKRRERAEARAKKLEAIAGKRFTGEEDDQSAVSGMSKRHRHRRKKKAVAALTVMEEKTNASTPVRVETDVERRRKQRAEARAKRMEAMFDERNVGGDDATAGDDASASVATGISRRHRMRRKKSAMTKASGERERDDWKRTVFSSVVDAERVGWKRSVYGYALNAEAARTKHLEARRKLDELNAAAQRRADNQRRLEERAKKIAARAERFDKLRHDRYGAEEDDDVSVTGSVASAVSKHRRRRRGRKSSSARRGAVPSVGEERPLATTVEDKKKQERERWCASVYVTALQAERCQWKHNVYSNTVCAEESKMERLQAEARIRRERAAEEAQRAKETRDALRAKKAEQMLQDRGADGVENAALYEEEEQSAVAVQTLTRAKSMRERRRQAARKKSIWWKQNQMKDALGDLDEGA